jgi:hypothetical protein
MCTCSPRTDGSLADELAARLCAADADDAIPDAALRRLFTAVVKRYAVRSESRPELPAVDSGVTATEATAACLALLRAADMQVFELGFWSTHFGVGAGANGDGGAPHGRT